MTTWSMNNSYFDSPGETEPFCMSIPYSQNPFFSFPQTLTVSFFLSTSGIPPPSLFLFQLACQSDKQRNRVRLMEFFVDVANGCRKLNNYNSFMAIAGENSVQPCSASIPLSMHALIALYAKLLC